MKKSKKARKSTKKATRKSVKRMINGKSRPERIIATVSKLRNGASVAKLCASLRDKDAKNVGYEAYKLFKARKLKRKKVEGVYTYFKAG